MAGEASRINGRKGGRRKSTQTILAEQARIALIKAYLKNVKPINEALLKKARDGDIQAIKELHDRVYGRPIQPISGDPENPLTFQIIGMRVIKDEKGN